MHTTTLKEIEQLESLLAAKKDRITAIERIIKDIRSNYKNMTDAQLVDAIRNIRGMELELKQEKTWCDRAETRIKAFYRPATVVA